MFRRPYRERSREMRGTAGETDSLQAIAPRPSKQTEFAPSSETPWKDTAIASTPLPVLPLDRLTSRCRTLSAGEPDVQREDARETSRAEVGIGRRSPVGKTTCNP